MSTVKVKALIGDYRWYRNPIKWYRWRRFLRDAREIEKIIPRALLNELNRDIEHAFLFGEGDR